MDKMKEVNERRAKHDADVKVWRKKWNCSYDDMLKAASRTKQVVEKQEAIS